MREGRAELTNGSKLIDRVGTAVAVSWSSLTMRARDIVLAMALLLLHGAACAQSFDCGRAATDVERAICRDKALWELDVALARQLQASLARAPAQRIGLLREERRWVAYRDNHCSSSRDGDSLPDCLTRIYAARIAELNDPTLHPKPKSASVVTVTHDSDLCSKMRPIGGPFPEQMIPKGATRLAVDRAEPVQVDIDNSGQPLWVLGWSDGSHAWDVEMLFAYDKPALARLETTARTFPDFVANATMIFPWLWTGCSNRPNAHGGWNDCLDASLPFFTEAEFGEERPWRSRYLHVTPFLMGSTTYFLLTTLDHDRWSTAFAVEPLPNARFKIVCILKNL